MVILPPKTIKKVRGKMELGESNAKRGNLGVFIDTRSSNVRLTLHTAPSELSLGLFSLFNPRSLCTDRMRRR